MTSLGYRGHLGHLDELRGQLGQYDLVWMSHVLEHSPTWVEARSLIETATSLLKPNGVVVVISPDVLSWKHEFFNVDWSHGYPTSIRNVAQLFSDVGLTKVRGMHYRNASTSRVERTVFALLSGLPHSIFDRIVTPGRRRLGDGFFYSWKAVFGWRQIMVIGQK